MTTHPSGNEIHDCERSIIIGGAQVCDHNKAWLIAEAGQNYGPDFDKVFQIIRDAKDSGADAVKFQTRDPKNVYAPVKEPGGYFYESDNPMWTDRVYGKHRENLEFDNAQWADIFSFCKEAGITAFSTPFDHGSADLLARLGVPAFKIASGDATNTPLMKHVAQFGKPMIVSTGGLEIEDVDRIVETLDGSEFALLQCSCIYPAPADVLNVRVVGTYRERYRSTVTGLSTHAKDWAPTLAAFVLGGRIFEHHFTHSRSWQGTDNHFSLEPDSLRALREACDTVLGALGIADKHRDPREESYTLERQKALYWKRDLPTGRLVTPDDVAVLCPNPGPHVIQPHELDSLVNDLPVRGRAVVWKSDGVKAGDPVLALDVGSTR